MEEQIISYKPLSEVIEKQKKEYLKKLGKKLDKVTEEPVHHKQAKLKSIARMDASGIIYVDPNLNVSGACNRQNNKYKRKNSSEDGLKLSSRAARKIKQRISAYHLYLKENQKKMMWCTFTLPPFHSGRKYSPKKHDKLFFDSFRLFLKNLKVNYNLQDYIFVCERQNGKRNKMRGVEKECTNAIHFHAILIFPPKQYVDYRKLNALWCHQLQNHGCAIVADAWKDQLEKNFNSEKWLSERIRLMYNETLLSAEKLGLVEEFKKDHTKQIDRIYKRNHFGIKTYDLGEEYQKYLRNPFQTEEIYDLQKLRVYLAKYITKNASDDADLLYCRPYAATKGFSAIDPMVEIPESDVVNLLCREQEKIHKKFTHDFEIGGMKFTSTRIVLKESSLETNKHYKELKHYILSQFDSLDAMEKDFDEWEFARKCHAYYYDRCRFEPCLGKRVKTMQEFDDLLQQKGIKKGSFVPVFSEDFEKYTPDQWEEIRQEFEKEMILETELVNEKQVDYVETSMLLGLTFD